jgi:protein arginine N-methyltransferase 2
MIILELLLTLLASRASSVQSTSLVFKTADSTSTGSTDAFLSSRLRFTVDSHGQHICLLDTEEDEVGVMMGWERRISAFWFMFSSSFT